MAETRRELFTTTVIGALGVTAIAGAVGGFVAAETFLAPHVAVPPDPGSAVAVHDVDSGIWYFFSFEDSTHCRLYSISANPPSISTNTDTATWLAVSTKTLIKTGTTTIAYTPNSGPSPAFIQVTINADWYLDGGSLANLIGLLKVNPGTQVSGSWNEIGKQ